MENFTTQLGMLADHFARRRPAILDAWRAASNDDAAQTTVGALTRAQFNDHIPQALDAFEHKLRSRPGGARAADANGELQDQEMKHGQQRWQQGYRLPELMREWGHLHLCLADELDAFAAGRPDWNHALFAAAHRELVQLVNRGIGESVDQFARMERSEAAGRLNDLEQAVAQVRTMERRRSQLIHQVVHDLRGNVQSVSNVADLLGSTHIAESERVEFATLLQHEVESVGSMLEDLMDLARLEAGQERRTITRFDASALLGEICRTSQPRALERRLYLRSQGPTPLWVEGDTNKVHRLLQNLLFNALNYTTQGGVTVTWGYDPEHWWLMVKDSGPGLMGGPGAPLAVNLLEATATAREADEKAAAAEGRVSAVLDQAATGATRLAPANQHAGEGIGLSIVKRLCELLDASLELISSRETGTTFRVVFPLAYPPGNNIPADNPRPNTAGTPLVSSRG